MDYPYFDIRLLHTDQTQGAPTQKQGHSEVQMRSEHSQLQPPQPQSVDKVL